MKNAVNRAFMAKKKNYNQPIVETTNLIVSSQALCTSPGTGIGGGGNSSEIGGSPIGD